MKHRNFPLFSGYRKRRAEAARKEAHERLMNDLNKTMAQQRARVMKVRPKAKNEENEKHPSPAEAKE